MFIKKVSVISRQPVQLPMYFLGFLTQVLFPQIYREPIAGRQIMLVALTLVRRRNKLWPNWGSYSQPTD